MEDNVKTYKEHLMGLGVPEEQALDVARKMLSVHEDGFIFRRAEWNNMAFDILRKYHPNCPLHIAPGVTLIKWNMYW